MDVAGALERARARVYQAPLAFVTTREPCLKFWTGVCSHWPHMSRWHRRANAQNLYQRLAGKPNTLCPPPRRPPYPMEHACLTAPLIGGLAWRPARACGCATWPRCAWSASCGAAWRWDGSTRCVSLARLLVRLARRRAVLRGLAGLLRDVHACCVHLSALPRPAAGDGRGLY